MGNQGIGGGGRRNPFGQQMTEEEKKRARERRQEECNLIITKLIMVCRKEKIGSSTSKSW